MMSTDIGQRVLSRKGENVLRRKPVCTWMKHKFHKKKTRRDCGVESVIARPRALEPRTRTRLDTQMPRHKDVKLWSAYMALMYDMVLVAGGTSSGFVQCKHLPKRGV